MKENKEKSSPVPFQKVFKYFWDNTKNYPRTFWSVFVFFMLASLISNVGAPILYKEIIDIVSLGIVTDAAVYDLMVILAQLTFIFVIQIIFFRIADLSLTYSQSNILRDLSVETYQKLTKHSYSFFAGNFGGSLVAKSKRYVTAFESIQDIFIFNIWMTGVNLIGTLIILFLEEFVLGLILLIWIIIYMSFTIYFAKKKVVLDLAEATADSLVTARLSDVITNILNIKMFATESSELAEFKDIVDKEEQARRKSWNYNNYIIAAQSISVAVLQVGGMYFAIQLWVKGAISAGVVVLVQMYFVNVFMMVWNLGKSITRLSKSFANAAEMVEIMEIEPSVLDVKHPEECRIKEGCIEFKNITFSYEDNESVLKDFSLKIEAGQKIGLVGYSGAGKTTISKVLLRFADITSGEISIDGQDISLISQDDLRSRIAYVPQDPLLFHRTLRENIAYGKLDASEEEIIKSAKLGKAHDFITTFPLGYETFVGERGVKLSGGERQRVAIARAILKDAPILVLDEATSSLDSVSEKHIQAALEELMKGRTSIVIAHRLSTVQKMDRIIVLGDKGILQDGTHDELIQKEGVYAKLWKHQTGGFTFE